MEAQGKAVSEEISKAHPDLGVATSYLDMGKQIQLSEQDQLRIQILDDIFKDSTAQNKADALEQRMNNAEEISMTEINDVLDGLYKQVEMVMDIYPDNEAGNQYVQALFDKIDKSNHMNLQQTRKLLSLPKEKQFRLLEILSKKHQASSTSQGRQGQQQPSQQKTEPQEPIQSKSQGMEQSSLNKGEQSQSKLETPQM